MSNYSVCKDQTDWGSVPLLAHCVTVWQCDCAAVGCLSWLLHDWPLSLWSLAQSAASTDTAPSPPPTHTHYWYYPPSSLPILSNTQTWQTSHTSVWNQLKLNSVKTKVWGGGEARGGDWRDWEGDNSCWTNDTIQSCKNYPIRFTPPK